VASVGNAITTANPALIRTILAEDSLRGRVEQPEWLDPWLWTGRVGRTYLVYAVRIPRRTTSATAPFGE